MKVNESSGDTRIGQSYLEFWELSELKNWGKSIVIFLQRVQYGCWKLAQSLQAISEVKRCKKLGWNANFIRQPYQREVAWKISNFSIKSMLFLSQVYPYKT